MNALGKVLTVFVFLGSLVWLGFTAALFATRADWKAAAKKAQDEAADAQRSADSLVKQVQAERDTTSGRLAASDQTILALRTQLDGVREENRKLVDTATAVADKTQRLQPIIDEKQANITTLQSQSDKLTAQVSTLSTDRDTAKQEEQAAKNKANDATQELNVTKKALEDAIEKGRALAEANRGAGGDADAAFRGDVIQVGDSKGGALDIITFSGGANSGVKTGKRYVVTRKVAPFYIGTVTVLDASDPGFSTGVFAPAAGQKLAGDYIPKKGDTVSSN
jgi:outer membrane murein-binding lipoprotein Lpp